MTIGAYLAVMWVLGIEKDLDLLGQADPVGRQLQDARLPAYGKTAARNQRLQAASPTQREWPAPIVSDDVSTRDVEGLL